MRVCLRPGNTQSAPLLQKATWYANGDKFHSSKVKALHGVLQAAVALLMHRSQQRKDAGSGDVPLAALLEPCLADALMDRQLKRMSVEKRRVSQVGSLAPHVY